MTTEDDVFACKVRAFIGRSMYTNALMLCEQYLAAKGMNSSTIDAIYLMGLCYFKMGKYRQAQMVLGKVPTTAICAADSLCDDYMLLLAQCALELNQHPLALSHIQATRFFRAYSVAPYHAGDDLPPPMPGIDAKDSVQTSIVFYTLGKIYQGIKSAESAAGAFVQSLYADPFMFVSFKELCDMGFFPMSSSEAVCKTFFSRQSFERVSINGTSASLAPMAESALNTSSELKRKHKEEYGDGDDNGKKNENKQDSRSKPPSAKKARKADGTGIECVQGGEVEVYGLSSIIGTYGRLYNALSQYDLKEFNSVLDSKECPPNMRNSPFVNIMKGKAYLDSNNHLEAEKLFSQAHKAAPYVLKGMEYYSTTLWRANKTALLTDLAYSMMNVDKLAPETLCAAGNCFSQRGDHRSALKLFARAAQVDENYAYAYFLAGDEYSSVDNLDKATASFLLAHDRQPRDVGCLLGLARIMLKRGKRDQANCYFSMALKVDPTSSAAHSYLAVSFLMEGVPEMALKETELAIKYSPSNTFARVKRVEALLALNRVSEACTELKALEPLVPVAALSGLRAEAAKRMKDALTEASARSAAIDIESGTSRLLKTIRNNHEIMTALNSISGIGRPVSIASSGIAHDNANGGNQSEQRRHSIEQNSLEDSLHMSGRMGPPVVVSSISPPARRGHQQQQQQPPPAQHPPRRDVAPIRMLNFSDDMSSVSSDGNHSSSLNSVDSFMIARQQPPPPQQPQQQQQGNGAPVRTLNFSDDTSSHDNSHPSDSFMLVRPPPQQQSSTSSTQQQQQQRQRVQVPSSVQRLEFVSGSSPVTRAFDTTPRVTAVLNTAVVTSTAVPRNVTSSIGGGGGQRDTNMSGISPLPPRQEPQTSLGTRGPLFTGGPTTTTAAATIATQGARALGIIPLNLNSFSSDDSRDEQNDVTGEVQRRERQEQEIGIDRTNLSADRQGQGQFPASSYVTPPTGQPPQTPGSVFSIRRRRAAARLNDNSGNNDGIDDGGGNGSN